MFQKLECVSIHTKDIEKSVSFYKEMGMEQNWVIRKRIRRRGYLDVNRIEVSRWEKFGVSNKQSSGY